MMFNFRIGVTGAYSQCIFSFTITAKFFSCVAIPFSIAASHV